MEAINHYQNNVEKERKMTGNYHKPLEKCDKILREAKGVNSIVIASNAEPEDSDGAVGGCGWHIQDGTEPGFFGMIGNLIEQYMRANEVPYTVQLKMIRELSSELVENITNKEEE